MSAIGTKRTSACALHMSAFDPKRTLVRTKRTLLQTRPQSERCQKPLLFHPGFACRHQVNSAPHHPWARVSYSAGFPCGGDIEATFNAGPARTARRLFGGDEFPALFHGAIVSIIILIPASTLSISDSTRPTSDFRKSSNCWSSDTSPWLVGRTEVDGFFCGIPSHSSLA
jgi:hypothetical protein